MTKIRIIFAFLAVLALSALFMLGKVDFGSDPAGDAMLHGASTLVLLALGVGFAALAVFLPPGPGKQPQSAAAAEPGPEDRPS